MRAGQYCFSPCKEKEEAQPPRCSTIALPLGASLLTLPLLLAKTAR
jgi:hypothetical protein